MALGAKGTIWGKLHETPKNDGSVTKVTQSFLLHKSEPLCSTCSSQAPDTQEMLFDAST